MDTAFIKTLKFNDQELIPAIAQCHETGAVLMMAWMSAESIAQTIDSGQVTYWSRSRQALWAKGATSGNTQKLISMSYDCDGDTILLQVDQTGPACHTGVRSCFFNKV